MLRQGLLQSKDHVVVATLKRSSSELSSSLRKVFKIDDHMGIAISGLVSDGRSLCKYMRSECLNHKCAHVQLMLLGSGHLPPSCSAGVSSAVTQVAGPSVKSVHAPDASHVHPPASPGPLAAPGPCTQAGR